MAHLHKSAATLRIGGDALDPAEVTRLLGCEPTESYRKGDLKVYQSGRSIVRKGGLWSLDALDREPEDVDAQVTELLRQLTSDLRVWTTLSREFEIDLFCGFFMHERDEGVEVSAETLKALGERGIKLAVCLYAPAREITEPNLSQRGT